MQLPPSASVPAALQPDSCTCTAPAGPAGPGLKRSHSIGPVRLQSSRSVLRSEQLGTSPSAAATALERCHISSPDATAAMVFSSEVKPGDVAGPWGGSSAMEVCEVQVCSSSDDDDDDDDADVSSGSGSDQCPADNDDTAAAAAAHRDQGYALGGEIPNHSISCSVITAEHVKALAQLPYLSSLELAPKQGVWDAASREGLLHLNQLTGLTKLSITWGDAAAAGGPLGNEDAAAAAQDDQLPLQKCLAGLTSLQELSISGAAVVDVAVLQRLQQLRSLVAEGLQVVNSDVMTIITEGEAQLRDQQQQHAAQQAAAGQGMGHLGAQPVLSTAAPAAQQAGRWASLPHLAYVHAVHPASDISLLLQSTLTPQLSHLGFVTRGPSDFARLLGQHGKLRTLHLAFAEEESWHPIAVVRLPTALPSLTSLTIDGSFWLPNALIVALGAMDVPIEHLSLTCKLAPPCLQRLQHLKKLKRLALHHVPSPPSAKGVPDAMLQLPAKLLPAQLQELEISNGWILH